MMTSSTASPGGPTAGPTATERLQGSLRHSAIARLLVEGRLSSPAVAAVTATATAATDKVSDRSRRLQVEVVARSSPPPPIDLSTNRGNVATVAVGDPKEQVVTVNDSSSVASAAAAAAASFTLSTITTMEKLRCILSYEIQSLLLRGDFSDQSRSGSSSSSNSSTIQYSCRLCSFAFSNVIDLLDHYRLHGDTLAHLGHKSPDILSQWFDYYLKTSPIHCSASSPQSLSAVSESLGVMTPTTTAAADRGSSPTSRLDLRTLLLKPFKASTTNTLLLSSSTDRPAPTRHRTNSESHPLRLGGRGPAATAVDGTHSRSSTPYTMISGLTDDENQQGQPTLVVFAAAAERCLRRGPTNGRQGAIGAGGGGVYPGDVVSVKYEADDMTTSPARSPLSTYSAHSSSAKDKGGGGGPHSQDSQSSGTECLGLQFQNGRLHRLTEDGRMAEERSPPTLKCEVDDGGGGGGGGRGGSPSYGEDRVVTSHCFELDDDRYLTLTNLRDHHHHHPHPKETLRKSSNISRLLHPGLRASDDRSPSHGYGSHPGSSVTPTRDPAMDHPREDTGNQSRSPPGIETVVEQEYAYKQYKRLRKSNAPKSYRQEIESSISPFTHSLSKTHDDSALSGTPSLPYDGSSEGHPQRTGLTQLAGPERGRITERVPRGYDVGVQCSLITPAEPWIAMTEGDDEEEEDDDEDNETREGSNGRGRRRCRDRMRVGRKRAFPADENEMPDITAADADCGGGGAVVQMRCSPCGITFDDDVIFSIHIGCHSHTDPFVCNICGRSCDNKYAFNTHILRGHHPT